MPGPVCLTASRCDQELLQTIADLKDNLKVIKSDKSRLLAKVNELEDKLSEKHKHVLSLIKRNAHLERKVVELQVQGEHYFKILYFHCLKGVSKKVSLKTKLLFRYFVFFTSYYFTSNNHDKKEETNYCSNYSSDFSEMFQRVNIV